jgi:hypothetical protein
MAEYAGSEAETRFTDFFPTKICGRGDFYVVCFRFEPL